MDDHTVGLPEANRPGCPQAGAATTSLTIAPPRHVTVLLGALVAAMIVTVAFADPAGQLLAVPAAAVASLLIARDLLLGPVLQADAEGLSVLSGWRRVRAHWSEVESMTVRVDRRAPMLDLDLGATVIVLGRTRLGQSPTEVLAALQSVRPPDR